MSNLANPIGVNDMGLTYKSLLTIGTDITTGLTTTLKALGDGDGNYSTVQLSTTETQIGNLIFGPSGSISSSPQPVGVTGIWNLPNAKLEFTGKGVRIAYNGSDLNAFDFTVTNRASIGTLHFGGASSYYMSYNILSTITQDFIHYTKTSAIQLDSWATGYFKVGVSGTDYAYINSTGLGLGATPNLYKLDVVSNSGQAVANFKTSGGTSRLSIDGQGLIAGTFYTAEANWAIGNAFKQTIVASSTSNAVPTITGYTQTGLLLQNTVAATASNQKWSPPVTLEGRAWASTPAASQTVASRFISTPIQGTTVASVSTSIQHSINSGAFSSVATFGTNYSGALSGANGNYLDLSQVSFGYVNLGAFGAVGNNISGFQFTNTAIQATRVIQAPQVQVSANYSTLLPASAAIGIDSTTQGFLTSRMSTTQRNAIGATGSSAGLIVFDTTLAAFQGFDGTNWITL